jgi:HK97 family phage prohead protease
MLGTHLQMRDLEVTNGRSATFLEGQAVPYDVYADAGWFMERHAQNSFLKSTTGNGEVRKLPLLLFHDKTSFPIGHAERWTHDGGLNGVWKMADTPEAKRAADAAASGDLVGMSVGFIPVQAPKVETVDDWNPELGPDHKDRLTHIESRLVEVSLTPAPVFADAEVSCVRTAYDLQERAQRHRDQQRSEADAWRAYSAGLKST